MSTILKALKKAEEGMARNTLPGKILTPDAVRPFDDMRARKRVVILLSLLAVIGGLAYYYMGSHERRATAAANNAARPTLPVPTTAPVKEASKRKESAPPPLRLSGVLWDESKPLAILNGKPLTVGEEIGGAKVIRINPDGVKVRYNGMEYALKVE
ncbi:MAG: hypothetical protein P8123_07835 [bacterium]|jgi:hypothetical protein